MAGADDRQEIVDTINRYATGIDLRDWDLYRSIFADEVEIDFESFRGMPPRKMSGDEWVSLVRSGLPGFHATQHVLTNFVIDIDGDRATATAYVTAEHFFDHGDRMESVSLGGYYTDTLKRDDAGWKIHACTLHVFWNRGDMGLYDRARERVSAGLVD